MSIIIMSGASGLAAAKRRRSKTEIQGGTQGNMSNEVISDNRPQLNTQQSFQYIWQRLMQCEDEVKHNAMLIDNIAANMSQLRMTSSGDQDNNAINKEIMQIKEKINSMQNFITTSSKNNNSTKIDNIQYVEVNQFNNVMSKIGHDMEIINDKMTVTNDYLLAVQNNNIVLKNEIARMGGHFNETLENIQEDAEQEDAEQEDAEQEDAEQEDAEQEDAEQEDAEQEDTVQEDVEQEDTVQEDVEQEDTVQEDTVQEDVDQQHEE